MEEGVTSDADGGFINRHGPFQSSLNDGKSKKRQKPSLLRGIGHMFRFGKHRKDGVAPVVTTVSAPANHNHKENIINGWEKTIPDNKTTGNHSNSTSKSNRSNTLGPNHSHQRSLPAGTHKERSVDRITGPNQGYAAPGKAQMVTTAMPNGQPTAINQTDVFNHRYSHYVNYDELQHVQHQIK